MALYRIAVIYTQPRSTTVEVESSSLENAKSEAIRAAKDKNVGSDYWALDGWYEMWIDDHWKRFDDNTNRGLIAPTPLTEKSG